MKISRFQAFADAIFLFPATNTQVYSAWPVVQISVERNLPLVAEIGRAEENMARKIEIAIAILLIIGGMLHLYGSFLVFPAGSSALVWSVGSSEFAMFLGLLGVWRACCGGRAISAILALGYLAWAGTVVAFGIADTNVGDPRVVYHVIASLILMGFSIRGAIDRPSSRFA